MTATATRKTRNPATAWRNRIVRYEDVPLEQLLANPRNFRLHPQHQQEALAGIIAEVGYVDPVLVQEGTDLVIDGHLRVTLAMRDGVATIPVQYVDLDDQEAAIVLATFDPISAMAERDQEQLDALLADLHPDDARLAAMLDGLRGEPDPNTPTDGLTDPDDIPDTPEQPITQPGDLWHMGPHKLLCGDATSEADAARLMAGKHANLLLTDPPYGVDYTGKTSDALKIANDSLGGSGTRALVRDALITATLAPGAAFYIFAPSGNFETEYRLALAEAGIELRQVPAWVKQDFVLGHSDYHFRHESILYGWEGGAAHYFVNDRTLDTVMDDDVDLTSLGKRELIAYAQTLRQQEPTTVIREDRPHASRLHPTMKPVALLRRLIGNSSRRGDLILDPFAGSGSTIIAAEQLGRATYAIDIDPAYCDVAVKRWEAFTGQTALREVMRT